MIYLSVVVPVYNAEACLAELVRRLTLAIESISQDYEIILVEDGGRDGSWSVIRALCASMPRVIGIQLSRNFGQHHAIAAGLDRSRGEWVVVMDCDLQDQPEEIGPLYAKALEGWDVVLARRRMRRDGVFKRLWSRLFYAILGFLSGVEQDAQVANFGIYHRSVIEAVRRMGERTQYFPVMVQWVGFRRTAVDVEHASRFAGATSYTFGRAVRLALNVCLAFSDRLLRLTILLGAAVTVAAILAGIVVFIRALRHEISVTGWASLIISVWMACGVLITIMGIIGLYVGRIFDETKHRPAFIVRDTVNG